MPLDERLLSIEDLANYAEQVKKEVYQALSKYPVLGGPIAWILAEIWSDFIFLIVGIWSILVVVVLYSVKEIGTAFLSILKDVRQEGVPEFNDLVGASMGEMFGVDFNSEEWSKEVGTQAAQKRAQQMGETIYDFLIGEFGAQDTISPEQGKKAAAAWTGFGVNFAVSNSMISMITDWLSLHHFTEFRELGAQCAHNLGLSRLSRHSLGVLMLNIVEKPYTKWLHSKYRPNMLNDQQYTKAFYNESLKFDAFKARMAELGFTEDDIAILVRLYQGSLSETQLYRAVRYGNITQDAGTIYLQHQGWQLDDAKTLLANEDQTRADSHISQIMSTLERQFLENNITLDDFNGAMQRLPIGPKELDMFRQRVLGQLETARKRPSLTEVEFLYVQGQVTLDYIFDWVTHWGYTDDDQFNIVTYLLLKANVTLDKGAVKKGIAGKKKAAVTQTADILVPQSPVSVGAFGEPTA